MKLYEPRFWRWAARRQEVLQFPTFIPGSVTFPPVNQNELMPEEDTREVTIDHVTRLLDEVTVTGHVEGEIVVTFCWYSHLEQLADDEERKTYLRDILRNKAPIHHRLRYLEDNEPV